MAMKLCFGSLLCAATFLSQTHAGRYGGGGGRGGGYNRYSATDFDQIVLEGGECGRGEEYTYLKRDGNPEYVAFFFLGAAFCFDEFSCSLEDTSPNITAWETWLARSDFVNNLPFNNEDDRIMWTIIAAPQCTEDFHIGNNVANLGTTEPEFHFKGAHNIELLIEKEFSDLDFLDNIEHLAIWGQSSGGYGSAVWGYTLFDLINENALKTLIVDAFHLDNNLFNAAVAIYQLAGDTKYFLANSPAFEPPPLQAKLNLFDITHASIVKGLMDEFCDVYVTTLYFDFDFIMAGNAAIFAQDPTLNDPQVWAQYMTNVILPQKDILDSKRSSKYIAQGPNHSMLTPYLNLLISTESEIGTVCPNAPTAQEYLSLVVGGQDDVRKYSGNNKRMHTFPKYTWNNLDIQCLSC